MVSLLFQDYLIGDIEQIGAALYFADKPACEAGENGLVFDENNVRLLNKTQVVDLLKQDGRVTGAVGFGLLTPTLLGALACGGMVYLRELVCIDDTNRTYEICKQYETIAL